MAEVYRARTMGIGGFEKWVAIKKVLPHLSENSEYMTMLIDEAKISVTLNHANIAQVLDLGEVDKSYFIAMEYVHGMDLATILKTCAYNNFTIPFEHTIHIGMQMCAGLYHAHSKNDEHGVNLGIIHRDVSPHNVLISYDGEVKVIDFGVAKASIKLTHTMSGIIKGKLLYMAPEQAMAKPLDPRADLFAVGLVLYKMTTGRLPFEGDNEFQVYNKLVAGKVSSPRKINPAIPEALDRVMMKVLSKKPGGRHADAMAMRNDLASVLQVLDPGYTSSRLARFMETYFPPRPISSGETPSVSVTPEPAPTPTPPPTPPTPSAGVAVGGAASVGAPPPPIAPPTPVAVEGSATVSEVDQMDVPTEDDARATKPSPGIPDGVVKGFAPSRSLSPPRPQSSLPVAERTPPPMSTSNTPTERPAIPPLKASDEPTAIVPSFPDFPVPPPGDIGQDMNTAAGFVAPLAPPGRRRLRTALLVLVMIGLVGGIAGGLAYVANEPEEPSILAGKSSPTAEGTSVAVATPMKKAPAPEGPPVAARVRDNQIAVLLESKPTGANVFAKGILVGTTPARLVLPKKRGGKRRYKIKAAGYKTASKWVPMDKDSTLKVRLKKKKK
jgi:serine/threonine protein kinase